jgi:hypothetical protein
MGVPTAIKITHHQMNLWRTWILQGTQACRWAAGKAGPGERFPRACPAPRRYRVFQLAEVAVTRALFAAIGGRIDRFTGAARGGGLTGASYEVGDARGESCAETNQRSPRGPKQPVALGLVALPDWYPP